MDKQGWICLHRAIEKHWIFSDAEELKAWITILLNVAHTGCKVSIGNQLIELKPGDSCRSLQTWANMFGWSRSKVVRYFKKLERDGMVVTKSVHKTTHLTVCNYTEYNKKRNDNETILEPKWNDSGTKVDTDNKDQQGINNEKQKRVFVAPTPKEVEEYARSKGYSVDGQQICSFYDPEETGVWEDSKGRKVKRWKSKIAAVWFKEENKIIPDPGRKTEAELLAVLAEINDPNYDPDKGLVIDD